VGVGGEGRSFVKSNFGDQGGNTLLSAHCKLCIVDFLNKKQDVMPSQKLMLCNYTSKYTKKFLEGFYVIRTTEDDDDDDVG
jgi:hypothetical protein